MKQHATSDASPSAEALLAAFEAQGRRCAGPAYQTVWAARALAEQTATLMALGERLLSDDEGAKRDHRRRKRLIEDVLAEARREPQSSQVSSHGANTE